MTCRRYETDGMRLLDGELDAAEREAYEAHVRGCEACRRELESLGRVVAWTDSLRLREPDDAFWDGYWEGVYRRAERNVGFGLLMAGLGALLVAAIVRLATSPGLRSFEGIATAVAVAGLAVLFASVVRERWHERRNDPYRGVKR